ncbi:MAG: M20/M25/M40 family metallo-hydrolase [Allosphingosinicella sp.]
MRTGWAAAAVLLLLVAAMAMKGWLTAVPDLSPPRAGGFDEARAAARLARLLGDEKPHPVDSAADDAVRGRLVAELKAMGLTPRVTDAWACNGAPRSRNLSCARVRNVVASIGPPAGPRLLLASHYDSTPTGPGAADDGIGMASMLEIAALMKDRRLARPVTFLFDEGEEAGLLGAKAFLERDPLAAQVDSLINLEARGVEGPAIMFETSRPDGGAIRRFARAATRPVANSMTADIYRLIPNSTDVTVFAARPWTMLNFAIIGNETRYHSPGDTVARLDRRSLRHMGEQALAAAEELAAAPAGERGGERLYADVLGRRLVSLPLGLGVAAIGALGAAFVWLGFRRRAGLGRAAAASLAALAGSAMLVLALQASIGWIRGGEYDRAHPELSAVAIDLAALAVSAAILLSLGRPLARDRLRAGFWLVFLLLGLGLGLVAPGVLIFFLVPPLVAWLGAALGSRWPRAERAGAALAWALLFLSWAPLLHLGEMLLGMSGGAVFAAISALILLPALVELKPALVRLPRRVVLGGLAAATAAGWAIVAAAPAYSPDRKQMVRIEYALEDGKGRWLLASDGGPLPAAFDGFGDPEKVPWSASRRRAAPAPRLASPVPTVEMLADRVSGAGRLLTLRLKANGAEQILLRAEPDAAVKAARIGGSLARAGKGAAKDPYFLRCAGRSCDGAVVDLLVGARGPLSLTIVGLRAGLPPEGAALVRARPADAQPQYSPDSMIGVAKVRL